MKPPVARSEQQFHNGDVEPGSAEHPGWSPKETWRLRNRALSSEQWLVQHATEGPSTGKHCQRRAEDGDGTKRLKEQKVFLYFSCLF